MLGQWNKYLKNIAILLLLLFVLGLCGCECIGGFGRDVQKTGKWIEDSSNKVRN